MNKACQQITWVSLDNCIGKHIDHIASSMGESDNHNLIIA